MKLYTNLVKGYGGAERDSLDPALNISQRTKFNNEIFFKTTKIQSGLIVICSFQNFVGAYT